MRGPFLRPSSRPASELDARALRDALAAVDVHADVSAHRLGPSLERSESVVRVELDQVDARRLAEILTGAAS